MDIRVFCTFFELRRQVPTYIDAYFTYIDVYFLKKSLFLLICFGFFDFSGDLSTEKFK